MVLLGSLVALTLCATEFLEAPVMKDAVPLDEPGRYRSSRSFDETLDYYQRVFNQAGGVRWRNVVNLPGIKAKHIESTRKKTKWEGINLYEYKGEVRLYVVPRDAAAAATPEKAPEKSKTKKP
jgi:hypothetical protein